MLSAIFLRVADLSWRRFGQHRFSAGDGLFFGLIAAYFGGWVDTVIMRVIDIQHSFPAILIALILLAVLGQGVDKIIVALITVQWAYYARTVLASALVETQKE